LETRIVWYLACLPFMTLDKNNVDMKTLPSEDDATEARNRVKVVEALLQGDSLDYNPLAAPTSDPRPHRTREFEFWYTLAEFVRLNDVGLRDQVLGRLRVLLDGRENRDLLYSIAIARQLAPRHPPGYESTMPQHLKEDDDPKHKLAVASKFIQNEAQTDGGSTNVVRRFSDIAVRAFINPGFNIASRSE
jgi:white-opaque regulator 2